MTLPNGTKHTQVSNTGKQEGAGRAQGGKRPHYLVDDFPYGKLFLFVLCDRVPTFNLPLERFLPLGLTTGLQFRQKALPPKTTGNKPVNDHNNNTNERIAAMESHTHRMKPCDVHRVYLAPSVLFIPLDQHVGVFLVILHHIPVVQLRRHYLAVQQVVLPLESLERAIDTHTIILQQVNT
jgi:hypothetical protein